jgi:chromatin remodeling complex protein RSC6
MCDDNLKNIMGGNETVTMFNMNRYITNHLVEKLDRSAYTHQEDEDEVAAATAPADDSDDDDDE